MQIRIDIEYSSFSCYLQALANLLGQILIRLTCKYVYPSTFLLVEEVFLLITSRDILLRVKTHVSFKEWVLSLRKGVIKRFLKINR